MSTSASFANGVFALLSEEFDNREKQELTERLQRVLEALDYNQFGSKYESEISLLSSLLYYGLNCQKSISGMFFAIFLCNAIQSNAECVCRWLHANARSGLLWSFSRVTSFKSGFFEENFKLCNYRAFGIHRFTRCHISRKLFNVSEISICLISSSIATSTLFFDKFK